MKATYANPCQVETKVKSATQSWLGAISRELPLHQVSGIGIARVGVCGFYGLASCYTTQPHVPHHPLLCAARYGLAFAEHLTPDFSGTIDLVVLLPDTTNLHGKRLVTYCAC